MIMNNDTISRPASQDLIASDKVEGTTVFGRTGEKLGSISHFMVGKRNGKASYAVMSFGGFLGMGTEEYALPWEKLEYDPAMGGYVVDITKEQLDDAPRYTSDKSGEYDRKYYNRVSDYYGFAYPMY
jgi:PRC-barrel domain